MSTGAWHTDLASLLKKEKSNYLGPLIGDIVSLSPFKVSIFGGEMFIRSDIHDIYISENPSDTFEVDCRHCYAKVDDKFEVGDKVLVIPDKSQKVFFITDVLKRV